MYKFQPATANIKQGALNSLNPISVCVQLLNPKRNNIDDTHNPTEKRTNNLRSRREKGKEGSEQVAVAKYHHKLQEPDQLLT